MATDAVPDVSLARTALQSARDTANNRLTFLQTKKEAADAEAARIAAMVADAQAAVDQIDRVLIDIDTKYPPIFVRP